MRDDEFARIISTDSMLHTQQDPNRRVRTAGIDGQAKTSSSGQRVERDEHNRCDWRIGPPTRQSLTIRIAQRTTSMILLSSGAELKPRRIDLRVLLGMSEIVTSHGNIEWMYSPAKSKSLQQPGLCRLKVKWATRKATARSFKETHSKRGNVTERWIATMQRIRALSEKERWGLKSTHGAWPGLRMASTGLRLEQQRTYCGTTRRRRASHSLNLFVHNLEPDNH